MRVLVTALATVLAIAQVQKTEIPDSIAKRR